MIRAIAREGSMGGMGMVGARSSVGSVAKIPEV